MIKVLLSLLLLISTGSVLWGKPRNLRLPASRTVILEGAVDGAAVKEFMRFEKFLDESTDQPIAVVINSFGGSVMAMKFILNWIHRAKSRGVPVICIVDTVAASAAFSIFAECSERYALPYSMHLWHPVRVRVGGLFGTAVTPEVAEELADSLKREEEWLVQHLRSRLPIDDVTFYKHYRAETLHNATDLNELIPGWMTIIDDYQVAN